MRSTTNTNDNAYPDWYSCQHEWNSYGDFELGDVGGLAREEVICVKCQCPGERYENGHVDWPTT